MMANSPHYALEKLLQAVDALVTGTGSIQERLRHAASINLGPAHPEDIPYDDLRRIFAGIKDDVGFEPAKGSEGRIAATMKITNDEDAQAIARRILNLFLELDDRLKRKG
jgi:hypothetical protein